MCRNHSIIKLSYEFYKIQLRFQYIQRKDKFTTEINKFIETTSYLCVNMETYN